MIKIKCINAINMKVANIARSVEWYRKHFGFEPAYRVRNGQVIRTRNIELVLSPEEARNAPLADPTRERCIHTLAFEVDKGEFGKIREEFADNQDLVDVEEDTYHSLIANDPDGYCVEMFYNKSTQPAH